MRISLAFPVVQLGDFVCQSVPLIPRFLVFLAESGLTCERLSVFALCDLVGFQFTLSRGNA